MKYLPGISSKKFGLLLVLLGVSTLASPISGSEIHLQAEAGDLDRVRAAIRQNPELVNLPDDHGRTPLHLACRGDHLDLVMFLVENGADVNAVDGYQTTPLHSLASRNLVEAMRVLLVNGATIDARNHSFHTPLHYAAMADHAAATGLLVAAGAKLEIENDYGRTPLVLSAREEGSARTIKILLAAGADVHATDRNGDDALALAAWRGKEAVVNLLLDAGVTPPARGEEARTLFRYAARDGMTRLFKALVEAGGNPTFTFEDNSTLAHAAAAGGSLEILRALAVRGLDLEARDEFGWTPLHYAARDGRAECVVWLCGEDIRLDARNLAGQTAYNVAVDRDMALAAEILKEAGADTGEPRFPTFMGPYLGQNPPGRTPRKFAPGIVSSVWSLHSSVAFSPDGRIALWSPMVEWPGEIYSRSNIMMLERVDQKWRPPEWAPFVGDDRGDVAFFAPDGKRVYFLSRRTLPGEEPSQRERIWFCDRAGDGWGPPQLVDSTVNDYPQHWQYSVDGEHSIYFSADLPDGHGGGDIYLSARADGGWNSPKNLGPPINTDGEEATPFIAPDGSYLLFQRDGDLLVSFRTASDSWTPPQGLGDRINTSDRELCPLVTPDGAFLFFLRRHGSRTHAWWVDAEIISELRSAGQSLEN